MDNNTKEAEFGFLEVDENLTPIQEFYYGKSIFITGATGLVGKILLEKLLRCCPGIGTIYIMMRNKRSLTVEQRLEKLLKLQLFDRLKTMLPNIEKKISVIYGDLEEPALGISEDNIQELKDNVHIIFHSAASVNWVAPLRKAAESNVRATSRLLELAKQFKKIEALVHVSTIFCHRDPDFKAPEHVTKTVMKPAQLLDSFEWLDDHCLDLITPRLVDKKHTTYLFTKALAENVFLEERDHVPVAIVRPSIVSPTISEPMPGWCDAVQGPQGLFLAAAKGFLRTMYVYDTFKVILCPADTLVNTLIISAWSLVTKPRDDILVVNCTLDCDKIPTCEELLNMAICKRTEYPLVNMYRYPDFTIHYSSFMYYVHAIFDQYIPALIGDTFLFIFTGKTLMWKLYRKIHIVTDNYMTLGKDPWICETKNFQALMNCLSSKDSEIFSMNTDNLNWDKYLDDMMIGGRKFLAKEDPSNIPYAKKKAKRWLIVTTILKWCIIGYILKCLLDLFTPYLL